MMKKQQKQQGEQTSTRDVSPGTQRPLLARGEAVASSTEASGVTQQEERDVEKRSNLQPESPPAIPFASLAHPLALPREVKSLSALDDASEALPTKRRSQSDPTAQLTIRDLRHALTVPAGVERDIVSRLAVEFQGAHADFATNNRPLAAGETRDLSTQSDSMGSLLHRLQHLFPENQDIKTGKDSDKPGCCICKNNAIFYPFQLADCGHVACGQCIYTTGVATLGEAMRGNCQLCGQAIRHQPRRVDNFQQQQQHALSRGSVASGDYDSLLKLQKEKRVHDGGAGGSGSTTGEEDVSEILQGVGYAGTFDRLPVLDISTTKNQTITLPQTGLRLTHCPADHNYSPFPLVNFTHLRTPSKLLPFFQAMKYLYRDDIYLLEEDDEAHFLLLPDRFTVRLTGWEHLASDSEPYSSSSSSTSRKRRRMEGGAFESISWQRGRGDNNSPADS